MSLGIAFLGVALLIGCAPRGAPDSPSPAGPTRPSLSAADCPILRDEALARGTSVPPLPLAPPVVEYPRGLATPSRQRDSALVKLVVDRNGDVPQCAVTVEAISDSVLIPHVIRAAVGLRFRPAQSQGQAAPAWLTMPLVFTTAEAVRALEGAPVRSVVDDPPQLLAGSPTPAYPSELQAQRLSGRVVVSATVTPEGRIDLATVRVVSSDHPHFTAAVRDVLPQLRFRPGRRGPDGPPIAAQLQIPFEFTAP